MKSLRQKIEALVFAGLKPRTPGHVDGSSSAAPSPLKRRFDAWIAGSAPSDPLYLSSRTTGQKLRAWSVVAIPALVLLGGVGLALSTYFAPPAAKPIQEPPPAEAAAKILPNLAEMKLPANDALEVTEVRIEPSPKPHAIGVVKNRTAHEIAAATINCDVTDSYGTQLGSAGLAVEHIPASSTKRFDIPIHQPKAAFVIVREIVMH